MLWDLGVGKREGGSKDICEVVGLKEHMSICDFRLTQSQHKQMFKQKHIAGLDVFSVDSFSH